MSTIVSQRRRPKAGEHASAETFYEMDDAAGFELINGVITENHVSIDSCDIGSIVSGILFAYMKEHGGVRMYNSELGYQCFDDTDTIRKPDASVVTLDRIAGLPNPRAGYMPITPDLAVEVLSLHDTVREVTEKVQEYLTAGFPLVWVLNPTDRSLTIWQPGEKPMFLNGGEAVPAPACMPGFSAKVSDFYAGVPMD